MGDRVSLDRFVPSELSSSNVGGLSILSVSFGFCFFWGVVVGAAIQPVTGITPKLMVHRGEQPQQTWVRTLDIQQFKAKCLLTDTPPKKQIISTH